MIMNEITTYIVMGLLLSGTIGLLAGFALTINCGKIIRCIFTPIIALLLGAAVTLCFALENKADKEKWNNGYCQKCGAKLELFDIEGRWKDEYFYYRCENGHIIRLNHLWETNDKEA